MEKLEAEIKNKKIKSKGIVKKIHSLFDKEKKSIVIVQDGLIKYANPRAIKLVGYAPEELIGTPLNCIRNDWQAKISQIYTRQ